MRKRLFRGSLIGVTLLICVASLPAQDTKPLPGGENEDPVYTIHEVDVKAKVTNSSVRKAPEFRSDCPARGKVSLTAVFRKSGQVTDVKLTKSLGCSFDKLALEAARKLKFKPALKAGQSVSQLTVIEYDGRRY